MNKKICLIMIGVLSMLIFSGCSSLPNNKKAKLLTVERPKDAKEKYGELTISDVQDENQKTLMQFEDALIKSQFYFGNTSISIILQNKTSYTMKISWDNAAFIDEDGISRRVIHEGVKLVDRNSPQAPSIIVRNGKIYDSITPSDNIYYSSGEWKYLDLTIGKNVNVSLLLPIEIEGVVNDYIFNFNEETIEPVTK